MSVNAPPPSTNPTGSGWIPAQSWRHFVAGGLGGMCGAVITCPLDVVKTRLQSSMFREKHVSVSLGAASANGAALTAPMRVRGLLWSFVETGHIIKDIYTYERPSALFKGLGPSLVGVIPARSINFFAYGNGKQIIANKFNHGREETWVYLCAAMTAGAITGTVTNPIWVVKTRLQLSDSSYSNAASPAKPKTSALGESYRMIKQIAKEGGLKGFYKGLSASYLGVTETTIQWVLYERLKRLSGMADGRSNGKSGWLGMLGSAGIAKLIATMITYPHEVLRTRLRQPVTDGVPKYTGLWRTLNLVIKEEGAAALYGGLSAHLLRVVPNAAVMFSIYEGILRWGQSQ